ncbi:hypothetical protein Hanom_Chr06g00536161 [Helianthus anomalus]
MFIKFLRSSSISVLISRCQRRKWQWLKKPMPVLKWDQGLFEQVTRAQQFPAVWDARYPSQGQTAADAPPGYITLYADFFGEGSFWLSATHFMDAILHHYAFHISQLSPIGMIRVRHFEFVCRSQGLEPTV